MARNQITTTASNNAAPNGGPYVDGNDNVYALVGVFSAVNYNVYKASDPTGGSWTAQDTSNRPTLTDLADVHAVSSIQDGDTIHIALCDQANASAGNVEYYTFRTSDHTSADTWGISETTVATIQSTVALSSNHCYINIRSDGDVIVFTNNQTEKIHGTEYYRVLYHRRETGSWTADTAVDGAGTQNDFFAVALSRGESDQMFLGYVNQDLGDFLFKKLSSGNSLDGTATTIDSNSQVNSVFNWHLYGSRWGYYDDAGVEKMCAMYVDTDADVWAVFIHDGTVQTAAEVTANNPSAGAAGHGGNQTIDGDTNYVVWIDTTDSNQFHWGQNVDDEASWDDNDTGLSAGTTLSGQRPVSVNVIDHGGGSVLAFYYQTWDSGDSNLYYQEESLGGVTEPLVAAIDGSATVTALLSIQAPLVSSLDASGLLVGDVALLKKLATDLDASGLLVGDVTRTRGFTSSLDASGLLVGDVTRTRDLPVSIDASAAVTAEYEILIPLEIVANSYIYNVYGRTIYER